MRFPVGSTGSKEEFSKDWYDAQPFGSVTSYGFHEGADINKRTGADTDLNQELKAISSGIVVYYHRSSHPNSGFGRHLVVKIDGPWGTRWVMYSHLSDQDFLGGIQTVSEGQIIGRIGKSGTPVAHLHFSIFKVDPTSLPSKIDSIAHNETELNQYWENPISFIEKYIVVTPPVTPVDIRLKLLDDAKINDESKTRVAVDRYQHWDQLVLDKANLQSQYDTLKSRLKIAINDTIESVN